MGKFIIKTRTNGEYQFKLKAGNGEIILAGEGYTSKASCLIGIESVKKNSTDDNKFERLESKNGKHYFNLKASNGQIIGTSEMYESKAGRDGGIESVKKNAPYAAIDDQMTLTTQKKNKDNVTNSSKESGLTQEIATALKQVKQIQDGKIQPLSLNDI